MKKKLIITIIFILLLPSVHAWGVAYRDDSFTLNSGEVGNAVFMLQNYVGDESKRIIVELEGDTEIATVVDKKDYYILPPRTTGHEVTVQLAIPKPARKNYEVKVNFISIPKAGDIGLATAKVIALNVKVPDGAIIDEPKEEGALDLQEVYKETSGKIKEQEPEYFESPTGLAVLGEGSSNTIKMTFVILSILVLLVIIAVFVIKRKRKTVLDL